MEAIVTLDLQDRFLHDWSIPTPPLPSDEPGAWFTTPTDSHIQAHSISTLLDWVGPRAYVAEAESVTPYSPVLPAAPYFVTQRMRLVSPYSAWNNDSASSMRFALECARHVTQIGATLLDLATRETCYEVVEVAPGLNDSRRHRVLDRLCLIRLRAEADSSRGSRATIPLVQALEVSLTEAHLPWVAPRAARLCREAVDLMLGYAAASNERRWQEYTLAARLTNPAPPKEE